MTAAPAIVEFVFIRHAQATHNVAAEIHGSSAYCDPAYRDAELTDEGHLQTARVRRERGGDFVGPSGILTPAVIYCSPLRRCRQTLLGVLPWAEGAAVRLDDRLMEPQSHVCNHRAERVDIVAVCPSAWSLERVAEVNPKDGSDSVVKRIRDWTAEMLGRYPGQRVLVVSHFTWIQNWFRIFKKEMVAPANCGILMAALPAKPHEKLD
jgi:broad specificity phosphatase PhoE